MPAPYPELDAFLEDAGTDGYLVDADGEDNNQYYLSGYHAPDNFVTLYADGELRLLVSSLEYTRAVEDSDADELRKFQAYDFGETVEEYGRTKTRPHVTADFLAEYGVDSVSVPVSFPSGSAEVLRERGVEVVVDYEDTVREMRAVKSDEEIEAIADVQDATENAMRLVEDKLAEASVLDGVVSLGGEPLTSERLRRDIEVALLDEGCRLSDCIVASGADVAKAHESGSGPIRPGEPVVVDIYPRSVETRYCGDMTRTFVKGEPGSKVREWYDLTREAFDAALETIEAGATGKDVDDAVSDVFEAAGYPTLRSDPETEDGFFHSTGHGVGLAVHEGPSLSQHGGELEAGHVVTVEPGLYEQGVGGVRLEDLVVVTEDGYENRNSYEHDLRLV